MDGYNLVSDMFYHDYIYASFTPLFLPTLYTCLIIYAPLYLLLCPELVVQLSGHNTAYMPRC